MKNATLSADTNKPNNSTYILNEDVELTFKATGLTPSKATTLKVEITDEMGNEVSTDNVMLSADSSGSASAKLQAKSSQFGYYSVEATLPDGTGVPALGSRPAGALSYAVVLDPGKRVDYGDAGSRFGMQGGFSSAQGGLQKYLGFRYLLDGSGWGRMEADHAGEFAEQRAAKGSSFPGHMANNNGSFPSYGVPVITAGSVPKWAMETGSGTKSWPQMGILTNSGQSGMASFTAAYAGVIKQDFAKQSSHYYQITWEPAIPQGFGGTPAQLVEFYKSSYAAIHKADPKAVVMGPTLWTNSETLLAPLWTAGLGKYVDAVSVHPYTKFPPESNGLVSHIRGQMKSFQGVNGANTAFVGTEHGFTSRDNGILNQAYGNIRSTLILLGEGFKFDFAFYIADFWNSSPTEAGNSWGYYWNLNPSIKYGTDKVGPKPTMPAYAAMTALLDGSTSQGPVANLAGTQMGYSFKRGSTTVYALWDYQATVSSFTLPVSGSNVQVCTWMDVCHSASAGSVKLSLGGAPTYVVVQD